MNARLVKVFVICALVVGLATALEITALAGPPRIEYGPGVNVIYCGSGYNVAPKVNVPVYDGTGYQLPGFYRGWTSTSSVTPNVHPLFHYSLDNNRAPAVRVPCYEQSGSGPLWCWSR